VASGWEVYFVIFVSAVVAVVVPLLLGLAGRLLSYRGELERKIDLPGADLQVRRPSDTHLGQRVNTRFFLGANLALIFVTLGLFLVPYSGVVGKAGQISDSVRLRGLVSVLTVLTFSFVGLIYASRKGDLDWLESVRESRKREKP
jgi:NADH:ubiquinone oxidoreductase subunit 3 (subunit A)